MAVTDHCLRSRLLLVPALMVAVSLRAATLPEDRVEAMYHRYDGGGVVVDGPAMAVRRHVTSNVSVGAEYYVDSISAASVTVRAMGPACESVPCAPVG